jgi:rod shape-determining protein MreC
MVLGTLDRSPPPFFRQGLPARSKLAFFAALALFLMVADARFGMVGPLRAAAAALLQPVQRVLSVPVDVARGGDAYLQGLAQALAREREAREQLAAQSERALRVQMLSAENARLRVLLALREATEVPSHPAEVLYEAADPYSRKLVIDRGAWLGVILGSPVINEAGVLGQVTRVYTATSEVTLLADKDAAIPVLNARTQQRAAAFGGANAAAGGMELRFTSANADVQVGDLMQTSGLDGIYRAGLPVARVAAVERRVESGFARILLKPEANPDGVRHVLVMDPLSTQLPPRPAAPATEAAAKAERQAKPPKRGASAGSSGSSASGGASP